MRQKEGPSMKYWLALTLSFAALVAVADVKADDQSCTNPFFCPPSTVNPFSPPSTSIFDPCSLPPTNPFSFLCTTPPPCVLTDDDEDPDSLATIHEHCEPTGR